MTYYVALDVSLRSVAVCVIDDQGIYHFEIGMLTQYLHDGLAAAGFQSVCLESHHVNDAPKVMRNKTA
mgnify:CR=1 FL=1